MVNWRDSSSCGSFGDSEVWVDSSSELVLVEAIVEATDVLREDLSLEMPFRLILFGPRILRSGAYSHCRPRLRQRWQGCSPVHCRCVSKQLTR